MLVDLDKFVRTTSPFAASASKLRGSALAGTRYDDDTVLVATDAKLAQDRTFTQRVMITLAASAVFLTIWMAFTSLHVLSQRDEAAADKFETSLR